MEVVYSRLTAIILSLVELQAKRVRDAFPERVPQPVSACAPDYDRSLGRYDPETRWTEPPCLTSEDNAFREDQPAWNTYSHRYDRHTRFDSSIFSHIHDVHNVRSWNDRCGRVVRHQTLPFSFSLPLGPLLATRLLLTVLFLLLFSLPRFSNIRIPSFGIGCWLRATIFVEGLEDISLELFDWQMKELESYLRRLFGKRNSCEWTAPVRSTDRRTETCALSYTKGRNKRCGRLRSKVRRDAVTLGQSRGGFHHNRRVPFESWIQRSCVEQRSREVERVDQSVG